MVLYFIYLLNFQEQFFHALIGLLLEAVMAFGGRLSSISHRFASDRGSVSVGQVFERQPRVPLWGCDGTGIPGEPARPQCS